jgi:hypothetical protein
VQIRLADGNIHFVYVNIMDAQGSPLYASAAYQPLLVSDITATGTVNQALVADNGYLKYSGRFLYLYYKVRTHSNAHSNETKLTCLCAFPQDFNPAAPSGTTNVWHVIDVSGATARDPCTILPPPSPPAAPSPSQPPYPPGAEPRPPPPAPSKPPPSPPSPKPSPPPCARSRMVQTRRTFYRHAMHCSNTPSAIVSQKQFRHFRLRHRCRRHHRARTKLEPSNPHTFLFKDTQSSRFGNVASLGILPTWDCFEQSKGAATCRAPRLFTDSLRPYQVAGQARC